MNDLQILIIDPGKCHIRGHSLWIVLNLPETPRIVFWYQIMKYSKCLKTMHLGTYAMPIFLETIPRVSAKHATRKFVPLLVSHFS